MLTLEDELAAREAVERARSHRVYMTSDGRRYKPALEIVKAARREAEAAARGPFDYGDFEFG